MKNIDINDINVKVYPEGSATLRRDDDDQYYLDDIDYKIMNKYLINNYSDEIDVRKNEKEIIKIIEGKIKRSGIIKVLDDSTRINVFVGNTGSYKYRAWPGETGSSIPGSINVNFRGITVNNKQFDAKEVVTKIEIDSKGNVIKEEITDLSIYNNDSLNFYPRSLSSDYGTGSTRDNIFKIIQVDESGDFYIKANDGSNIKLYLSRKDEGLRVAMGRFEGIMNANYHSINLDNTVFKDTSFLGGSDSDLTHYNRFAYDPEGNIEEHIFIHKENIHIGGGYFDESSHLFKDISNSFIGLSTLERNKLGPIIIGNLKKVLERSDMNKVRIHEFIDDLNDLYNKFTGTGDLRLRGVEVLKRELSHDFGQTIKTMSDRDTSFSVDRLTAQDFIKNDNKFDHDKLFMFTYVGGKKPKQPVDILFDYAKNRAYVKDVKMDTEPIMINLMDDKGKITTSLKNHLVDIIGFPNTDPIFGATSSLAVALGDFMTLFRFNALFDDIEGMKPQKLIKQMNHIFDTPLSNKVTLAIVDDIPESSGNIRYDDDYNIIITNNPTSRPAFRTNYVTDLLYKEYSQYTRHFNEIISNYKNIHFEPIGGKYKKMSGEPGIVNSIESLVEYSRIKMLQELLSDSKLRKNPSSGFTTLGYFLLFHKASTHVPLGRDGFRSNSLLRNLYIPNDDSDGLAEALYKNNEARPLVGKDSYFLTMLHQNNEKHVLSNSASLIDTIYDKRLKSFHEDLNTLSKNSTLDITTGKKAVKKLTISKKELQIMNDHQITKKATGFGSPKGKENTFIFLNRQLFQLNVRFHPSLGKFIDSTISSYIGDILRDYLGGKYDFVLSLD